MLVIGEHCGIQCRACRADGDVWDQRDEVDQIKPDETQQGVHETPEGRVDVEPHESSSMMCSAIADSTVPYCATRPIYKIINSSPRALSLLE